MVTSSPVSASSPTAPSAHESTPRAPFDPREPASRRFRDAVSAEITDFLAARRPELAAIGGELDDMWQLSDTFTQGGKRLRPAFCYWGYTAIAGQPTEAVPLLRAAASLDLLHVSALIHDDVMDASDTRRGVPAAHRQFEKIHAAADGLGRDTAFGRAGAILLGDLLIMWSAQQLSECGLTSTDVARALPLIEKMRTEVTAGQYLDVVAQHSSRPLDSAEALARADRVVEYKSARYTVQRPVQFGAALAGATASVIDGFARFGSPLGKAFQFRDDVLGVFGEEAKTGKPAGDDLREGKRTVLVAHALAQASDSDAAELRGLIGNPYLTRDQIERAREIISGCGALDLVEEMIAEGLATALAALDALPLTAPGHTALRALAQASVNRDF